MNESVSDAPLVRTGLFADMLTTDFDIIAEKRVNPDEQALLLDFETIAAENLRVIGTSIRVTALDTTETGFTLAGCGASKLPARIRLRLPRRPTAVSGQLKPLYIPPLDALGEAVKTGEGVALAAEPVDVPIEFSWDERSRTVLLSFDNMAGTLEIKGNY